MIGGAFSSAMLPTAQAYAADLTTRENRTAGMAVIGAAFGLAIIFGPVIGGVTAHLFGLTAPIWLSTAVGLVNALMAWLRLPEPARDAHAHLRAPASLRDVAVRAWPLLAVAMVSTGALVLMEQTVAFLVEDRLELAHEETPIWMGGGLFVYGVVAVAVQGGLVRRVRIAPTTLVMIGMPITIAGLLTLMLAPHSGAADRLPSYATIVVGMALQGLGQGLVLPGVTSAMSLAVEDTEQGAIAGLNTSAQGMGRLVGPLFGGALYQLQTSAPYAVSAGLLATVLLFVIASPQMRAIARRAAHDHAKNVATTQSNAAATNAITGTRPSTDPTR
jgi:MFS family permease